MSPDQLERLHGALGTRYRLERELGRGGMATVYLAEDLKLERKVAIKVLRPDLAAAIGSDRFLQEIKLTARLEHPHILTLHDSGEAEGFLYYVMPYVEGESLRDRVNRDKRLPVEDAVRIVREVADALDYAHQREIVHRDIKPENILLEAGHAVVSDFGIARAVSAASTERLTETGLIVGTPEYMSPEQAAGDGELDGRSDVYALGCVLYESLAGEPPFTGPTLESVVRQHLTTEPPSVTALRPTVPETVVVTLGKALAKDPADRFATCRDFSDALADIASERTQWAKPAREPAQARRATRIWSAVAITAVALLALVAWQTVWKSPDSSREASTGIGLVDERPSVAVLPFANRSGREEDRYFTDGIHDELLTRLSKISGLRTISRTSVEEYRETPKDVREIGAELGVEYLLEGGVQRSGQRVRVNVQLIDAVGEGHLWGETYDRELTAQELFDIQSDISEAVASALRAAISAEERARIVKSSTQSLTAYDRLLQGWSTLQDVLQLDRYEAASRLFTEAIDEDPDFIPAHLGLAAAHMLAYQFGIDRSDERARLAKGAIDRAAQVDPDLPDVHFALGRYLYAVEKDFEGALRAYRQAERGLRGDYAHAIQTAFVQRRLGRWDDALRSLERAQALNPRGVAPVLELGISLRYLRRYDEADAYFDRVLELDPSNERVRFYKARLFVLRDGDITGLREALERLPTPALHTSWWLELVEGDWQAATALLDEPELEPAFTQYWIIPQPLYSGWTHAAAGQDEQARLAFQRAADTIMSQLTDHDDDDRYHRALGLAYAGLGRTDEAVRAGERSLQIMPPEKDALNGSYNVFGMALIHAQLGQAGPAVQWLDRFLSAPGNGSVHTIDLDPRFDPIRSDPRFREMLQKHGRW